MIPIIPDPLIHIHMELSSSKQGAPHTQTLRMIDHELTKPTTNTTPTPVWDAVSQWTSVTNPDWEYWWQLTGPHISHMMVAAGYPLEAQYNALIFHYHWIVSFNPCRESRWLCLTDHQGSLLGSSARRL